MALNKTQSMRITTTVARPCKEGYRVDLHADETKMGCAYGSTVSEATHRATKMAWSLEN